MKNIRSLNKVAKADGLQLIQAYGYLYWIALTDEMSVKINMLDSTSVSTNKFSDLTFDRWLNELKEIKERIQLTFERGW